MIAQAENSNGLVIDVPRLDVHIAVSNGALKILGDVGRDAGQWAHENPWLFVATLAALLLALFFSTQRVQARIKMKREFKRVRDRQLTLPFPRHERSPSPHRDRSRHDGSQQGDH